jgi:hypothetical protein
MKHSRETPMTEEELDNLPSEALANALVCGDDHWSESARALITGLIEHNREERRKQRREEAR